MECDRISESITRLRMKLSANINSVDNIDGCLLGEVDDFVRTYDAEKERVRAQFDKSRAYWNQRAKSEDESLNDEIAGIQARYAEIQHSMKRIFTTMSGCRKWDPTNLIKLPNFSSPIGEGEGIIAWPTENIIKSLNLEKPPVLT